MPIQQSQIKKSRRGQTLVEALIALSVITMGFLGIIALLSKSFFYNRTIVDQLTGSYLASEGIEIAKNLIDHDAASRAAWGSCFNGYVNAGGVADLALDQASTDCTTLNAYSPAEHLQFDPLSNAYGYRATAGSAASIFTRDIRITVISDQIVVSSIVAWNTGPITGQSVVVEDHFYHWR